MKYIFVLIFIIVFIRFDTSIGYTTTSPWYTHITYMFQHASVWHLILNSISFIVIYTVLEKHLNKRVFLPLSFLTGVFISFTAMYEVPTVGISSVIYTMIGLYIGATLFYKHIKIADTRKYLLNICVIVISLTISLIKNNSNFYIHFYSFSIGFLFTIPIFLYQNKNKH